MRAFGSIQRLRPSFAWFLSKSPRCFRNSITTLSSQFGQSKLKEGPNLKDFIQGATEVPIITKQDLVPYLNPEDLLGYGRKVYGCQMNVSDTEIVWSILKSVGYSKTDIMEDADVVLVFTCAIRENAENKIWNLLLYLKGLKHKRSSKKSQMKIGIMGCMAERLKTKLIEEEQSIDLVAGPDSYRDLPRLLALTDTTTAINVALSLDETYADVTPVLLNQDSVSAYVSIMRGCNNMCTYCIVPFTRGRERSRPIESIIREVKQLSQAGIKEITLLGQNVNSYRDLSIKSNTETHLAKGFKTVYKAEKGGIRFAELLEKVANVDSQMRIRFTSPHPKDFPDEVLQVISSHKNVCCNIHLPAQSGNNRILERMRRGYSREAYLELVDRIKDFLPNVTISSDFICGFCGESDKEFNDTLSLIENVGYQSAFLFAYSMREKTTAHRRFKDDIMPETKQKRLLEMVKLYRKTADTVLSKFVGTNQTILASKRSEKFLAGRTDGNVKVIIPFIDIPVEYNSPNNKLITPGDYVNVLVTDSNSQVLKGAPLHHTRL